MIEFAFKKKLHSANGAMQLDIACSIADGAMVGLYGASGAGKTSVLRMLAGFLQPGEGFIHVDGKAWYNSAGNINMAPQLRSIGFVFQDYALFPNMTVRENLVFALQEGGPKGIVDELLGMMQLGDLQHKKPQALSGGQKQRVALARALVRRPRLLLLDEPLSAIDNELRETLQNLVLQIHRQYKLTTILVSHDIPEIIKLCDKAITLEHGIIKAQGVPAAIFFDTAGDKGFVIEGIVAGIEKTGITYTLTVLAGNRITQITVNEAAAAGLEKGSKVELTVEGQKPLIKKA